MIALRKPPSSAVFQSFPGVLVTISHEMEPKPFTHIVQMMEMTKAITVITAAHISTWKNFSSMYLLCIFFIFNLFSGSCTG